MQNNKVALIILDGFGINANIDGNAIAQAHKPNLDNLFKNYPNIILEASQNDVGLPKGQFGNSEVGHLNIGAGRIVYTGLSLINNAIETGTFYENSALLNAINHAKNNISKVNIIGLVSHGGVHSSFEHIKALIELMKKHNQKALLHIIADGRDVAPKAFIDDLKELENTIKDSPVEIATISGRYYAMDRDKRWDRVQLAYDNLTGKGKNKFTSLADYVNNSYYEGTFDEFIVPAYNANLDKPFIKDNDAIIFANFRPDRARELSHLFIGSNTYDYNDVKRLKNLYFVTMMKYEGIEPNGIAFPPLDLQNVLGKVLEENKKSQLRIAETEKYAHVTFFFDGGKELDYQNEKKILVPSPKVATYDLQPEMSAYIVTEKLLENMNQFDVTICNFANCDMVGHTGNMQATIKAVEAVDVCIGKIMAFAKEHNITLFITADHGNADVMLDEHKNVVTKHSINPVPFICTDHEVKFNTSKGKLANIAPTLLDYLNLPIPMEMSYSLIKKN